MSRNGAFGQGRMPLRRNPGEQDPYAAGPNGANPQWQQGGYPDPQYNTNGAHPGYAGNQQGYHYPPSAEPDPQYQQQGQGYAPGPNNFHPQDQRNYDLGSYMPANTQGYAPAQEQQHFHPQDTGQFAPPPQSYAESETDYDDGLAEGDDEPRGRRWMLITAALVGAICIGGGLAYTYKMLFTSGRPSVAKNIDIPSKVKTTSGNKETAQLDKKLPTRLGEDGSTVRTGSETEAQEERATEGGLGNNGVRPVRIIPITPGDKGTGATTGNSTKSGGSTMVVVPGLMVDTGGSTQRGGATQQGGGFQGMGMTQGRGSNLNTTTTTTTNTTTTETTPQKKVAVTTPTTSTTTGSTGATGQVATKVPVPRKEASTGATTTPVSNGYVAVLSSQRSRMDAVKAYAGIDQKYRDMLASSTFDVQEADLGEKGIWYRAVVGPPRSFDGAKKVCDELKAAGYPACWPARY